MVEFLFISLNDHQSLNELLFLGFSYDNLMGDDNVVLCTSSGLIQHRYNTPEKNLPVYIDDRYPGIGLNSNATVMKENGWLKCSFTRHISLPSIQNYFDLNKNYIILAASGEYDEKTSKFFLNKIFFLTLSCVY